MRLDGGLEGVHVHVRDDPHRASRGHGRLRYALYVTHSPFAEKVDPETTYNNTHKAYFCGIFTKHDAARKLKMETP